MSEELVDESNSEGVKVVIKPYDDMKVKDSPKEGAVPEEPKEVTAQEPRDDIIWGAPERK